MLVPLASFVTLVTRTPPYPQCPWDGTPRSVQRARRPLLRTACECRSYSLKARKLRPGASLHGRNSVAGSWGYPPPASRPQPLRFDLPALDRLFKFAWLNATSGPSVTPDSEASSQLPVTIVMTRT